MPKKKAHPDLDPCPCACGCGELITPYWDYKGAAYTRFKFGHRCRLQEHKLSSELEQELIEAYLSGMFLDDLLKKFNIGCTTLYRILQRNSIPSLWKERKTNYREDSNFFSTIDNELKAYWLGFIAADGCVQDRKGGSKSLTIALHSRDAEHVEKFKRDIQSTRPIFHTNYDRRPTTKISINDRQIVSDLIKHGMVPRKSWKLEFPTSVPHYLLHHFIRGYFDGDGCIRISENKLCFNLAGTYSFCKGAQEVLVKNCQLNYTKLIMSTISETTFYVNYSGNRQVRRILQYLYYDATVYLDRKRKYYSDPGGFQPLLPTLGIEQGLPVMPEDVIKVPRLSQPRFKLQDSVVL